MVAFVDCKRGMEWEGGLQPLLAMISNLHSLPHLPALPRWRGLASDAPNFSAGVSESAPPPGDLDDRNKTNVQASTARYSVAWLLDRSQWSHRLIDYRLRDWGYTDRLAEPCCREDFAKGLEMP
jgi:hypothetical protein